MLAKNMIKEVKSGKSRSFYIVDRNSAYQLVANHSSTVIEFPHTKTQ
jgi:hypothetical protein